MSFFKSLTLSVFLLIILLFTSTHATDFLIQNNCPYTVWAAAYPAGGKQLDQGESGTITVPSANSGQYQARIWGRTGCNFDFSGKGNCQTGDCNGLLQCAGYGASPNTLAEVALNGTNQLDFFDISLVDGFNIPMEFSPTSDGCTKSIKCSANINEQCPNELKAPGGCNNPCTVFKTAQYCCTSGKCGPTDYSKFFKNRCPDAYSYPQDDASSSFMCPTGTNYKVVFCPDGDTSIVSKRQLYLLCEI